jgi:hypothetical protein
VPSHPVGNEEQYTPPFISAKRTQDISGYNAVLVNVSVSTNIGREANSPAQKMPSRRGCIPVG